MMTPDKAVADTKSIHELLEVAQRNRLERINWTRGAVLENMSTMIAWLRWDNFCRWKHLAAVAQRDEKIKELENVAYNVPLCADHAAAWFTNRRFKEGDCWICCAAVAQAKEEKRQPLPQRLYDLVRYCRTTLHEEHLITDAEYTEMCSWGAQSARRLEDYDAALKALELKEPASNNVNAVLQKALQLLSQATGLLSHHEDCPEFLGTDQGRGCECAMPVIREQIQWFLSEHSNAAGAPTEGDVI